MKLMWRQSICKILPLHLRWGFLFNNLFIIMSIQHIIRRVLMEETQEQKVLHIPSLKVFGLDRLDAWNNLQNFLKKKGNPPYSIGGDLDLAELPIKSLGNLISVDGNLDLYNTKIKSLGKLKSVGGDLILRDTFIDSVGELTSVGGDLNLGGLPITSLGNLKTVGQSLVLANSLIKSLGNLESVGADLFLARTPIESLGNLKFVGGDLYVRGTPISQSSFKGVEVGGGIMRGIMGG